MRALALFHPHVGRAPFVYLQRVRTRIVIVTHASSGSAGADNRHGREQTVEQRGRARALAMHSATE